MRQARAVLPAFASDVYYTSKASSSVAAALICGTPLLANLQLLRAYSYLPPEATLTQVRAGDGGWHCWVVARRGRRMALLGCGAPAVEDALEARFEGQSQQLCMQPLGVGCIAPAQPAHVE